MKKFLEFHTVEKLSILDATVFILSFQFISTGKYLEAFIFWGVGLLASAGVTVLVERMK